MLSCIGPIVVLFAELSRDVANLQGIVLAARANSARTFRPMVPVYRQDMAAFLHRLYSVGM